MSLARSPWRSQSCPHDSQASRRKISLCAAFAAGSSVTSSPGRSQSTWNGSTAWAHSSTCARHSACVSLRPEGTWVTAHRFGTGTGGPSSPRRIAGVMARPGATSSPSTVRDACSVIRASTRTFSCSSWLLIAVLLLVVLVARLAGAAVDAAAALPGQPRALFLLVLGVVVAVLLGLEEPVVPVGQRLVGVVALAVVDAVDGGLCCGDGRGVHAAPP